jgi:hypothetical protein
MWPAANLRQLNVVQVGLMYLALLQSVIPPCHPGMLAVLKASHVGPRLQPDTSTAPLPMGYASIGYTSMGFTSM